jgi:large conductance mechanosensitive channel
MGFGKEFRDFAMRGNVVDLAVGVIIGGAFGKIVDSAVNDLMMPIVGIFGDSDFTNLYIGLNKKAEEASLNGLSLAEAKKLGPVFAWGSFVTVTINFVIMAFIIFLMIKGMNSVKKKKEEAPSTPPPPPEPTLQEKLLMEIRDELKAKS